MLLNLNYKKNTFDCLQCNLHQLMADKFARVQVSGENTLISCISYEFIWGFSFLQRLLFQDELIII